MLTKFSSNSIWIALTLLVVAIGSFLFIAAFLRRQQSQNFSEMAQVDKYLLALEKELECTSDSAKPLTERLLQLHGKITQLHKRDAEVRHLVRVQGLIDHELAIGNRVFVESLADESTCGPETCGKN